MKHTTWVPLKNSAPVRAPVNSTTEIQGGIADAAVTVEGAGVSTEECVLCKSYSTSRDRCCSQDYLAYDPQPSETEMDGAVLALEMYLTKQVAGVGAAISL